MYYLLILVQVELILYLSLWFVLSTTSTIHTLVRFLLWTDKYLNVICIFDIVYLRLYFT